MYIAAAGKTLVLFSGRWYFIPYSAHKFNSPYAIQSQSSLMSSPNPNHSGLIVRNDPSNSAPIPTDSERALIPAQQTSALGRMPPEGHVGLSGQLATGTQHLVGSHNQPGNGEQEPVMRNVIRGARNVISQIGRGRMANWIKGKGNLIKQSGDGDMANDVDGDENDIKQNSSCSVM
jgi:hypothetical protein